MDRIDLQYRPSVSSLWHVYLVLIVGRDAEHARRTKFNFRRPKIRQDHDHKRLIPAVVRPFSETVFVFSALSVGKAALRSSPRFQKSCPFFGRLSRPSVRVSRSPRHYELRRHRDFSTQYSRSLSMSLPPLLLLPLVGGRKCVCQFVFSTRFLRAAPFSRA